MAKIDIDSLSEQELIDLNHKIVSRLRFLREMRSHAQMLDFRIGERVGFQPPGQPEVLGTLTRYNKKSVTAIADNGQRWNVHPGLLHKTGPSQAKSGEVPQQDGSVVMFRPPNSRKPN
jgi:hypothetical protein